MHEGRGMNHVIITEGTWSTSRDPCRLNDPLDPIISIIELVAGSLVWTKLADIAHRFTIMYHLLTGLYEHLTRKDEYSVVIIGLDNVSSSSGSTFR